ncbi:MAG: HAD-IIIA family hydrolase [Ignavibacteriaceae bacterium]|jgi:YrbI family 3-deoxy-D-manno-octulosonate 8-phosphate phosphatase
MSLTKKEISSKLKKIKIVLSDIDGVLTDGGMYYTEDGMVMKKFFVKDGMGTTLLKKAGLLTGVISTDVSLINKTRAERLKMDFIFLGVWEKEKTLDEICEQTKLSPQNIAFIGDDVNDLLILQKVGFAACPVDAVDEVKKFVHYKCKNKGGKGAYREVADLIIKYHHRNSNEKNN